MIVSYVLSVRYKTGDINQKKLLIGPPGTGKCMLAKRLPTVLPPLILDKSLETREIHNIGGLIALCQALVTRRDGGWAEGGERW